MSSDDGRGPRTGVPAALLGARAELVLDGSVDVLMVYDGAGIVQWASPSLATTFGYDPAAVVGTPFRLGPDDTETTPPALEAAVLAATTSDADVAAVRSPVLCADGTQRWADSRVRILRKVDGSVDALVVSLRDVNDEVRAQRALAASEARFRILAENATDVILQSGADRRIVWASPSVLEVLGWEPEEVVGRVVGELVHPDDLVRVGAEIQAIVAAGATTGGRFESRFATASGGWRWMSGSGRVLRDDSGRVVGAIDALRDVEEEHRTRDALVESELRYRLIAENASDVVFRMGLDAVVIWTSDGVEGILGWRPDQVMGKPGTDFIDPRDLEWAMENMAEMSSGKAKAVRMRMFTADGGTRWIESRVKPVLDDDGQVVEFIGGWRDIEAEVQAQLELERRARTDDLTGLLNRGAGLERLGQQLSDPRRAVRTMAVAFCDIDEFKRVNDTMGHAAGDHLLRVVAERVRTCVRDGDVVIRMGGDEVLVVLDGVGDIGAATTVAEKLRRVMAVPVPFEDRHITATMSIGVTVAHEDDTVDALVARADKAMYLAKQAGRDQVVPFE